MPYNLGEWPKGVKRWSAWLIAGGFFLGFLMSSPFPIVGLVVGGALVGAGTVVGLFGISRWVFKKLRGKLAVEILPRLPKEP